jgi:hypothetical protein
VASKAANDVVVMADQTWPLNVSTFDNPVVEFGYNTPCQEPDQGLTAKPWVQHLCQTNPTGGAYWGKGHWECSPPQGSDITIQLDRADYFAGDTMYITVTIYNSGNVPLVDSADIAIAIDRALTMQFPDARLDIAGKEITVQPYQSVDLVLEYKLPGDLSSTDSHLLMVQVGSQRALLPFRVTPWYEAQWVVPAEVRTDQPFQAQLIITNTSARAIEIIFVELKAPYGVEIAEGDPTWRTGVLHPGAQALLDWRLVARTPNALAVLAADITSWNGGASRASQDIDILASAGPEYCVAAFAFGSRMLHCPTFDDPSSAYTMVYHGSPAELAYEPNRGWGYEVIYPQDSPHGYRAGYGVFGPFDDSPNNRNKFPDACPEELYDSFIGAKDFPGECSAATLGDPRTPCAALLVPAGIIFRADVPNGWYRFVAAAGDADNLHAHRILAEDGGSGPPSEIGAHHVVLVSNFDQAQYARGETDPERLGEGVFARVGFGDKIPPPGDGILPSPQFINMDEYGLATDGFPESPVLKVTQGYIRIHQLQGNSNDGPGGPRDGNGGDLVVLELWRLAPEDTTP